MVTFQFSLCDTGTQNTLYAIVNLSLC